MDEALIRRLAERRVDHMFIAQPRDLLGLEALAQRLLHIDEREFAGQAVKDVGIGVAGFHALRGLVVYIVEIAAHEHQQLAVVGLPRMAGLLKAGKQRLHLGGRPLHDGGQRLLKL